ncbi:MAG: DUF47 family protein [Pseudomonadales bacterium]
MSERSTSAAKEARPGLLARLKSRILPSMPDFYALLVDQCAVTADGTGHLVGFLRERNPAMALEVRRLEHEGDRIKARNLATLQRSFSTPMDREDIYDAVMAIDEVLNYAKTCVREMEILGVSPDEKMVAMVGLVDEGARALRAGFESLRDDPEAADRHAERARKTERDCEKVYRAALAELFDPVRQVEQLKEKSMAGASTEEIDQRSYETLVTVTQMLKRREIYRHLSNAADHVSHAAQVLEDIVNKAT